MQHIAIMKKSWKLTDKILSRNKKIESRGYKFKHYPWNKIKPGELIYFKDSGDPVTIKANVKKVIQFSDLTQEKVKKILTEYGKEDGIYIEDTSKFFKLFKDKNYCILIFFKNPKKIKPFNINKKGFGMMSAWICIENVNKIKI